MHKLIPDFILKNMSQQQDKGQFQAVCLFVDTVWVHAFDKCLDG